MAPVSITSRTIIRVYRGSKKLNESSPQLPLHSFSTPLRERLRFWSLLPFNSSSRPFEIRLQKTLPRTGPWPLPVIFHRRDKARGGLRMFYLLSFCLREQPKLLQDRFWLAESESCLLRAGCSCWTAVSVMMQMSTAMLTLLMRCFEVSLHVWTWASGITTCFFTCERCLAFWLHHGGIRIGSPWSGLVLPRPARKS